MRIGVTVGTGVRLGASVGVAVRGGTVAEGEGDELGDGDADGDGLVEGAATCWDEITAAPRRSSATSATAAKTVNTVDQRSAGRRTSGEDGCAGATSTSACGRSSWAVASGSAGGGFSCTRPETARAVPNGRTLKRSVALGGMQDVRDLVTENGEKDDENDREEYHAHQIVDELLVSLHDG